MGISQLMHIEGEFALVATSHGHILGAHMNQCIVLNYVMLCYVNFWLHKLKIQLRERNQKDDHLGRTSATRVEIKK